MKRQAEILQSLGIDGISQDLIQQEAQGFQDLIELTGISVNMET